MCNRISTDANLSCMVRRDRCTHRPVVLLSEAGAITGKYINNIDTKHENKHVDKYIIMWGHIHRFMVLKNGAMWASPPTDEMAGAALSTDGMAALVHTAKNRKGKAYEWQKNRHAISKANASERI